MKHRFPYQWTLNNTHFTKDKGKVFSCFACGGGSTMGYKLAGFDVIGMNEIDPKMAECYITNHNPKYSFIEDIRVFKDRDDFPILNMVFFEPLITFGEVYEDYDDGQYVIPPSYLEAWKLRQYGDNDLSCTMGREFNRPNSFFSSNYIYKDKVPNTITGGEKNILFDEPRGFNKNELCKIGSFPLDYNFLSNKPAYLIGMSVPPVMMAQIASRIYEQWLTRIQDENN